jgi:hypothetical protein
MDTTPVDQLVNIVPSAAGRRNAMRSLGALGMALLMALGRADPSLAKKKRRKRRKKGGSPVSHIASTVVQGASSPGLPVAAGSLVGSHAACAGPGKLVGGGYIVNGTVETMVNVLVVEAAPNATADTYFATLRRTTEEDATAGAVIVAYAICIP